MRVSGTALDLAEVAFLAAVDVEGVGFVVADLALAIVEDGKHDEGEESGSELSEAKTQKFCECGGPGPRPVDYDVAQQIQCGESSLSLPSIMGRSQGFFCFFDRIPRLEVVEHAILAVNIVRALPQASSGLLKAPDQSLKVERAEQL